MQYNTYPVQQICLYMPLALTQVLIARLKVRYNSSVLFFYHSLRKKIQILLKCTVVYCQILTYY